MHTGPLVNVRGRAPGTTAKLRIVLEIRPYPEFSWSISRQRLLENCPRAYYYRYYLSHNGWLREAPEQARIAYRLSKLTSLDALLGQEMDERAREVEARARADEPLPRADQLEARTRENLRRAWRSSRDERAAFEARPKDVVMLRSFYVEGCPPSEAEGERVNEKLVTCHQHLLGAEHWDRLRECGRDGCLPIPAFAHFFLDGAKAFAAGDMAYVHQGTVYLVDWKTGRPGADDGLQVTLAAHSLFEGEQALAGMPMHATLNYLFTGDEERVPLPDDLAARAADTVAAGVKAMRSFLRDVEANAPLEEGEFPRRESGLCASCNYSPLCLRGTWAPLSCRCQ